MFGYVRPDFSLLEKAELELYKNTYCGLCRTLRRKYGAAAAFLLNYDLVFLALMHAANAHKDIRAKKIKCPLHPIYGKNCASGIDSELSYAADCNVLLAFGKFCDDFHDGKVLKKFFAAAAVLIYFPCYMKARRERPQLARQITNAMKRQFQIERRKAGSLDSACEATGEMLRAVFRELGGFEPCRRKDFGEFGCMLGRYIYICDSLDDLAEDKKHRKYNPLAQRREPYLYALRSMQLTLSRLEEIYRQLNISPSEKIIDNIVYFGTRNRFYSIYDKRMNGGENNDRPLQSPWRGLQRKRRRDKSRLQKTCAQIPPRQISR